METTHQEQLKVPKQTMTVELGLMGQRPRRVELYFVPRGDGLSPRQELIDLLMQDRDFLPAEDVHERKSFLFNTRKVLWIAICAAGSGSEFEEEWLDRNQLARVELEDGTLLDGELLYAAPAGNARVLDHLNNPDEPYIRLRRVDNAVVLVNKSHILRVYDHGRGGQGRA